MESHLHSRRKHAAHSVADAGHFIKPSSRVFCSRFISPSSRKLTCADSVGYLLQTSLPPEEGSQRLRIDIVRPSLCHKILNILLTWYHFRRKHVFSWTWLEVRKGASIGGCGGIQRKSTCRGTPSRRWFTGLVGCCRRVSTTHLNPNRHTSNTSLNSFLSQFCSFGYPGHSHRPTWFSKEIFFLQIHQRLWCLQRSVILEPFWPISCRWFLSYSIWIDFYVREYLATKYTSSQIR